MIGALVMYLLTGFLIGFHTTLCFAKAWGKGNRGNVSVRDVPALLGWWALIGFMWPLAVWVLIVAADERGEIQ